VTDAPARAVTGMVAALIAADEDETRDVAAQVQRAMRQLPGVLRAGISAAALAVDARAVLRTGRRLADLDADRREATVRSLAASKRGEMLLEAVKIPVLMAAGAHRVRMPLAHDTPVDDPPLDCTPSADWPSCTTADVVVVGSGAGGAMVARTLARAGLAVVVLEEGRAHPTAEFRERQPAERFPALYRDGGATVLLGSPPLLMPVGRAVGGTTLVNSGTCYRTPERVRLSWRSAWGLPVAERLPDLLDEVERTLGVAPQPIDVLGNNGLIALRGAQRLGWAAAPLRRNAAGCGGCGQCAAGCPSGAKNGVHRNALPEACAAGARIVTNARVVRLLVDAGRAAGVLVRRPDGSSFEILAPLVVVAAGAPQTPALLRRSGLGGHPGTGRGMAVHPATAVAGRFDEPVLSWQGVLQSVGIEQFHDAGVLIEATSSPPGLGSFTLPGAGRTLRAELDGVDRLAYLGAMVADRPSGRVMGARRPLLRYDLAPEDAAKLRHAITAMGQVLFAAGAREVLTGLRRHPVVSSPGDLDEVASSYSARELHLAAFHPTGTMRMGRDVQTCPVDVDGRLRGVEGVYVADASVLPTCPEVNPQLSIMAVALGIADEIVAAVR
jgi:choline dehydrogenase-like flavoprotein